MRSVFLTEAKAQDKITPKVDALKRFRCVQIFLELIFPPKPFDYSRGLVAFRFFLNSIMLYWVWDRVRVFLNFYH